jgi:hypothetical protein
MSLSFLLEDVNFLFGKNRIYGDRVTLTDIDSSFSQFSLEGDLLVLYRTGKFPITYSFFESGNNFCPFIRDFFTQRDFDSNKIVKVNPKGLREISVYFSERPGEQLKRAILRYNIRVFQEQNV